MARDAGDTVFQAGCNLKLSALNPAKTDFSKNA
jgi:hypothetical protein